MEIVTQELLIKRIAKRRAFWKVRCLADLVLAAGASISAAVFCYYIYFYGWTGQRQFTSPAGALVYYLVPSGLCGLLLAALRMRLAFKKFLAASCLLLTVTAYLAEFSLVRAKSAHVVLPFWGIDRASLATKKEIRNLANQAGIRFDTRDSAELIAEFRKRGNDAVAAVMLGNLLENNSREKLINANHGVELFPVGAISNKTTILCNESGQYITYESDEHGFRNPQGIWKFPRADVAALGESFAQGYCVPNGKTFVDRLRTIYPVTLNLGMSGESALLQLAAMKEYLPRYAPPIVLWFYCEGIDLSDLRVEAGDSLLMRYLEPNFSQGLLTRQNEIDHVLRRFSADIDKSASLAKLNPAYHAFIGRSLDIIKLSHLRRKLHLVYGIANEDSVTMRGLQGARSDILASALAQARNIAASWGGTLYFVYLPSWSRYSGDAEGSELERATVLKVVDTLGIPVIDIQAVFQAHHDPLSFFPMRKFGHYNETGNQWVADGVLKYISRPVNR